MKIGFNKKNNPAIEKRPSSIRGAVTFFAAILALVFVMSIVFRVNKIEVVGNTHYKDSEIINAIEIEEGDNLFFFDRFAAISRVFAKLPYIEEVSVVRALPGNVIINVVECEALAYIMVGDENWTMDSSCKMLGKAKDDELEYLIPIKGINPGTLMIGETLTITNKNPEALLDFLQELLFNIDERKYGSRVDNIDVTDVSNVRFDFDDNYKVWLGGMNGCSYKFGILASAMTQLTADDVGIIDLSSGNGARFVPN